MMWDVVILLVVVIFMASYWLVSSLRQRGLYRTLFSMLKGVAVVVTFGYFVAAKAFDVHSQRMVLARGGDDDEDDYLEHVNPYSAFSHGGDGTFSQRVEFDAWEGQHR